MDIAEQIRAQIRAHPFELVAAAALFGAWLGFSPPREKARGFVLGLVRDAAFQGLGAIAKRWLSEIGSHRETDVRRDDGSGEWLHGSGG